MEVSALGLPLTWFVPFSFVYTIYLPIEPISCTKICTKIWNCIHIWMFMQYPSNKCHVIQYGAVFIYKCSCNIHQTSVMSFNSILAHFYFDTILGLFGHGVSVHDACNTTWYSTRLIEGLVLLAFWVSWFCAQSYKTILVLRWSCCHIWKCTSLPDSWIDTHVLIIYLHDLRTTWGNHLLMNCH